MAQHQMARAEAIEGKMSDQIHALQDNLLTDGGIVAKCRCGWISAPYATQESTDGALGRHIKYKAHIKKIVDEAPPLTEDQRNRIMMILDLFGL